MRTTLEIPDELLRRAKAAAAIRGTSLKVLIIAAIERELNASHGEVQPKAASEPHVIHLSSGRKLDLTGFDFDDLLT